MPLGGQLVQRRLGAAQVIGRRKPHADRQPRDCIGVRVDRRLDDFHTLRRGAFPLQKLGHGRRHLGQRRALRIPDVREPSGEQLGRGAGPGLVRAGDDDYRPAVDLGDRDQPLARGQTIEPDRLGGQPRARHAGGADRDDRHAGGIRCGVGQRQIERHRLEPEPGRHVGRGGDVGRGRRVTQHEPGAHEIGDLVAVAILEHRAAVEHGLEAQLGRGTVSLVGLVSLLAGRERGDHRPRQQGAKPDGLFQRHAQNPPPRDGHADSPA